MTDPSAPKADFPEFRFFGRMVPLLPVIVASALFMENMDSTVIATSLPVIARDLLEDPVALKLALTSYLVSLAIFIPVSGWMSDRFGSKTVFQTAMGVFMFGSMLCAFSSTLGGFVAARFVQGMGGAMMIPVGRLVILRSTEKAELVRMMSYLTIPALLGPVIGPPLGGFISTYFHWRWIFFINVPISILGMYMAYKHVPQVKEADVRALDVRGFVLSAFGLALLMMGFATLGRHLVSTPVAFGCVAAGAIIMALYLHHAKRAPHPLLQLSLFRTATFRAGVVGGFFFRAGIGAIPFLLPLMMQLGFGLTPFQSGTLTCATAIGALGMKTAAASILKRWGFRQVLIWNAVFVSLSLAVIAMFQPTTPHLLMMAILLFGGCLRSLQFTSLNTLAYADIDPPQMSQATGLASVTQQLAAGMGVTIGAACLQSAQHFMGHPVLMAVDFSIAFVCIGLVALSSLFWLLRLPPDAGATLSGKAAA
ncbi:MFS transporter [Uliginosibacterium sp. H3]|uniref:MFS transporter n=1 Tax=Uliginosibacterium silvisoli TaxID=3114758 RepID=A0ABU6JY94_9RHOO|nr:MFS transporter [Uliginosibacterium sp. H3]